MNDASIAPALPAEKAVISRSGIYVGNIRGIALYLDASWFLLLALVIWSLSSAYFPYYLPGKTTIFYLLLSTGTALMFYVSLLLHELGHSIVSQRCGIPVPRITLSFIGGIAEIAREPEDARTELKIALGGPAVTVVLVLLFYALALAGELLDFLSVAQVSHWLAVSNLYLLCFNAIPGYPLDGGRVLRAWIWMKTGRLKHATYISSRMGIAFAWFLMLTSIYFLIGLKSPLQAFIFFLIGSFLKNAAAQGYEAAVAKETLGEVQIGQVMTPRPLTIPSHLPLNLVVDDFFFTSHHSAYPVARDDGTFCGILRLNHVTGVPKEKWPYLTALEALDSTSSSLAISPAITAMEATRIMSEMGTGRLAVVDNDRVVGMVTRHDIFRYMEIRAELA